MTETIKETNDALNAGSKLTRIHFGDYEASGKQVLLVDKLATGDESMHIADCATEELAAMIAEALNEHTAQREELQRLVAGYSLDDFHKNEMLKAFGFLHNSIKEGDTVIINGKKFTAGRSITTGRYG